ncbi:MAG: winged helix-turn-helix domain-containing protein [Candidatus Saccharibacteria bacterium]
MKDADVQEQIRALRQEVGELNDSLLNLRREDAKRILGEQWRSVLLEKIERFFQAEQGAAIDKAHQQKKANLEDLVRRFIANYLAYGKEMAAQTIDDFEAAISKEYSSGYDLGLIRFTFELIRQMRGYLDVSDTIMNPVQPKAGSLLGPSKPSNKNSLSPSMAEAVLSPLANAWRINILLRLADEDDSLAELSRALGLKKGHLQFHLNDLLSAKYIQYNRKSHLYSITPQGTIALDEIAKLIDRLNSIGQ